MTPDDASRPRAARGPASDAGSGSADRRTWTVLELLRWTAEHFASRGIETARLDAECLLAHALGCERLRLYVDFEKPVTPDERARFRELVKRRAGERVPVSQLVGRREFWSLPLRVTPDVLTPRPETETLVEAALTLLPDPEVECRILDVGTGSGAIALALARERPKAHIVATDISEAALQIARENADGLQLSDRLHFASGDLYQPVAGEEFELIVSNPPYLARAEAATLPPELGHEPDLALFAGEDGLVELRRLAEGAGRHLTPGGGFAVELDPRQAEAVADACRAAGLVAVEVRRDLAGKARVVVARRAREV